jgi:hypothetical protein
MEPTATPAVDASSRIVDGEKQHRIRTTNGVAVFFRALVCQPGWHQGAKEFARARKLAKAIGQHKAPEGADVEAWSKEPCEFWLSERLRDHGKKCLTVMLDKGVIGAAPDDDAIEPFLIDLGLSLKDD